MPPKSFCVFWGFNGMPPNTLKHSTTCWFCSIFFSVEHLMMRVTNNFTWCKSENKVFGVAKTSKSHINNKVSSKKNFQAIFLNKIIDHICNIKDFVIYQRELMFLKTYCLWKKSNEYKVYHIIHRKFIEVDRMFIEEKIKCIQSLS